MTIGALNPATTQTTEGIATQSPAGLAPLPAFNGEPVDIHSALEEVRRMKEFQPPQPSPFEDLLKQPWIKKLFHDFGESLDRVLKGIGDLLGQVRPEGMPHLPQNIRDIFSGFIGFILVLVGLYAFYLLLTLFLRWKAVKTDNKSENVRLFEQTQLINSAHHYQQANQAASGGNYEAGIRELYMATLCLLDENALIPYEVTRTNLEYQRSLAEKARTDLKSIFFQLAQRFEAIRYGNQPAGAEHFKKSHQDYWNFQEKLPVTHG